MFMLILTLCSYNMFWNCICCECYTAK